MIQDRGRVSEWVLLKDGRYQEKFRIEEILLQALMGFFATQDRPIPNGYYSYNLEGRSTFFRIV
jgi:hypothetical protein